MIVELNESNFYTNIAKGVKLVYFYASWCGFCNKQKVILEDMKDITIYKINSDNNPNLVLEYGINAFPTFLIFKDGKEINKISGMLSKFELMNILIKYI